MDARSVDSGKEVTGHQDEGKKMKNGAELLKTFPCRRPSHANPRVFEFERYLNMTGVTKALNQALGNLCAQKPKPDDPMRFIVEQMCEAGQVTKWSEGVISLRNELSQLRTLVMYAQTENERLHGFLVRSGQLENEDEFPGEDWNEEEEFEDEETQQEEKPKVESVPVAVSKTGPKVKKSKSGKIGKPKKKDASAK